ncbi:MAG: helix-turn-helix transcriptional regulator [Bacteroidota bacterium]
MQRKSERLFRIYQRLKTVPQTIDELHRWSQNVDLGIGKRTLYRYLEELEISMNEPGFELIVTNHDAKEKRWQVVSTKRNSDRKRKDAIRSYYLLKNLSGKHLHSVSSGYLESLEQEFNQTNEPEHRDGLLQDHLIVTGWAEAEYAPEDTAILLRLLQAIESKEYVLLELLPQLSAEQPIDGYHEWAVHYLVNHRGSLYIAAVRKPGCRFHFLDIESIRTVKSTAKRFRNHPHRSEVQKELSRRFGITAGDGPVYSVSICFYASMPGRKDGMNNPFIEKRSWHPTQKFKYDNDGHVILQFKSQLNRELVGWLFMWLDHIKVLGPPPLVSLIQKKLNDMQAVMNGRSPLKSLPARF